MWSRTVQKQPNENVAILIRIIDLIRVIYAHVELSLNSKAGNIVK